MKPIAIVQHVANDGPGFFATWLDRQGLPYQVFRMDLGQSLPADIRAHAGLCILGGPMSANDSLPYIEPLLALTRTAIALDIPVIGHCLGGQLLARALGAKVGTARHKEIGWSDLRSTDPMAASWFGDDDPLHLFQWHGESFEIPVGTTQLLRGEHCHNQAFVHNNLHLGMQFHCEVDEPKVIDWLMAGEAEITESHSPGVQNRSSIEPTLHQDLRLSQRIASHIYQRWAKGLRV